MKPVFLPRLSTMARILMRAATIAIMVFLSAGPFSGATALADESTSAEVGPVPQDALARLGRGAIRLATLSPDERRVAVRTEIGMYMYDAANMQQMWYAEGYDLLTEPVDFSPDSKRLLGGHGGDRLVSWDVETGDILAEFHYDYRSYSAVFSGDGRYVIGGSGSEVVVWDSVTGALIYWKNNFYSLGSDKVAASPDGTMFASAGIVAASSFDEIAVWDTATGVVRNTFKVDLPGQYFWTNTLRFTPDNKYLVAGFEDGWIKGWNLETGTLAFTINVPEDWVQDLGFSADSSRMVVGGYQVYVYQMPSGSLLKTYYALPRSSYGPWYALDGSLKSFALDANALTIIDVESGSELARLEGHLTSNSAAALSPDGSTLLLGKYGGRVEVRDLPGNTVRTNLKALYSAESLAFSPDGTLVAGVFLYNWDDIITKVSAWDLTTGRLLYTLSDNDIRFGDIQFAPDGNTLLISSGGSVRRVDAHSGETLTNYTNIPEISGRMVFSPDGRTVAVMSDSHVTLWDLAAGAITHEFPITTDDIPDFSPGTVVFSPDGLLLAAGRTDDYDSASVGVWNVQTGERVAAADDSLDHGPFGGVRSIAFTADDGLMAVGLYDGMILLVDLRSGQIAQTLQGHGSNVSWLTFMPQTGKLISASDDGTVVFWQIP